MKYDMQYCTAKRFFPFKPEKERTSMRLPSFSQLPISTSIQSAISLLQILRQLFLCNVE